MKNLKVCIKIINYNIFIIKYFTRQKILPLSYVKEFILKKKEFSIISFKLICFLNDDITKFSVDNVISKQKIFEI